MADSGGEEDEGGDFGWDDSEDEYDDGMDTADFDETEE